jgi:hypothetical protein
MSGMRFSFPRTLPILLLAAVALSCSSAFQLSADDEAILREAMDLPLTFVVPRDHAIDSWDRAVDFVDRYSTMTLRTATDSVLTTYETPPLDLAALPTATRVRFGYSVRRYRDFGGIGYTVQCTPSSKTGEKDADQNAHLMAYYIQTGSVCDRCIIR